MQNLSISDVAKWFLSQESMTPKKLQKMLYYAKAWSLVFFNDDEAHLDNSIFPEDFEAWVHGPVNWDIYQQYKPYGYHEIDKVDPQDAPTITNPDLLDLLHQIMDVYDKYDGNTLEKLTHQETPWQNARGDAKPLDTVSRSISDKDMYNYYGHLEDTQ